MGTCTYRVPIWPKKFTSSYFQVRSSKMTFWDIFRAWNSKRQKNLMLSLCFESSSTSHSSQIVARKTTHACPIFHSILPPNFSISPIIFKRESLAFFDIHSSSKYNKSTTVVEIIQKSLIFAMLFQPDLRLGRVRLG